MADHKRFGTIQSQVGRVNRVLLDLEVPFQIAVLVDRQTLELMEIELAPVAAKKG